MSRDSDAAWPFIVMLICAVGIGIALLTGGTCEPEEQGYLRSFGKYGGELKVCDDGRWIPVRLNPDRIEEFRR